MANTWVRRGMDGWVMALTCRLPNLTERNPPLRGGFLFTTFPHQEPWEDPPRRTWYKSFEGCPLTHVSWWGNIVNRKPPRGGGFLSIKVVANWWRTDVLQYMLQCVIQTDVLQYMLQCVYVLQYMLQCVIHSDTQWNFDPCCGTRQP